MPEQAPGLDFPVSIILNSADATAKLNAFLEVLGGAQARVDSFSRGVPPGGSSPISPATSPRRAYRDRSGRFASAPSHPADLEYEADLAYNARYKRTLSGPSYWSRTAAGDAPWGMGTMPAGRPRPSSIAAPAYPGLLSGERPTRYVGARRRTLTGPLGEVVSGVPAQTVGPESISPVPGLFINGEQIYQKIEEQRRRVIKGNRLAEKAYRESVTYGTLNAGNAFVPAPDRKPEVTEWQQGRMAPRRATTRQLYYDEKATQLREKEVQKADKQGEVVEKNTQRFDRFGRAIDNVTQKTNRATGVTTTTGFRGRQYGVTAAQATGTWNEEIARLISGRQDIVNAQGQRIGGKYSELYTDPTSGPPGRQRQYIRDVEEATRKGQMQIVNDTRREIVGQNRQTGKLQLGEPESTKVQGEGMGGGGRFGFATHLKYFAQGSLIYMTLGQALYGATAAFGKMIDVSAQTEVGLTQVGLITGRTKDELSLLGIQAIETGRVMGQGPVAMTAAWEQAAQVTKDATEQQQLLSQAATLSTMTFGKMDAGQAMERMVSIIKQNNASISDGNEILDIMANAYKTGRISIQEMSEVMAEAGPVGKTLGMDWKEFTSLVVTSSEAVSMTADRMRTMWTQVAARMYQPAAAGKLANLGIGVFANPEGTEERSTIAILGELHTKYQQGAVSAMQYNNIVREIFGPRYMEQAKAILANWDALEARMTSTTQVAGTAKQMTDAYLDSFKGKTDKLNSSVETLYSTFSATNAAKGGITASNDAVDTLTKSIEIAQMVGAKGLALTFAGVQSPEGALKAQQDKLLQEKARLENSLETDKGFPKATVPGLVGPGLALATGFAGTPLLDLIIQNRSLEQKRKEAKEELKRVKARLSKLGVADMGYVPTMAEADAARTASDLPSPEQAWQGKGYGPNKPQISSLPAEDFARVGRLQDIIAQLTPTFAALDSTILDNTETFRFLDEKTGQVSEAIVVNNQVMSAAQKQLQAEAKSPYQFRYQISTLPPGEGKDVDRLRQIVRDLEPGFYALDQTLADNVETFYFLEEGAKGAAQAITANGKVMSAAQAQQQREDKPPQISIISPDQDIDRLRQIVREIEPGFYALDQALANNTETFYFLEEGARGAAQAVMANGKVMSAAQAQQQRELASSRINMQFAGISDIYGTSPTTTATSAGGELEKIFAELQPIYEKYKPELFKGPLSKHALLNPQTGLPMFEGNMPDEMWQQGLQRQQEKERWRTTPQMQFESSDRSWSVGQFEAARAKAKGVLQQMNPEIYNTPEAGTTRYFFDPLKGIFHSMIGPTEELTLAMQILNETESKRLQGEYNIPAGYRVPKLGTFASEGTATAAMASGPINAPSQQKGTIPPPSTPGTKGKPGRYDATGAAPPSLPPPPPSIPVTAKEWAAELPSIPIGIPPEVVAQIADATKIPVTEFGRGHFDEGEGLSVPGIEDLFPQGGYGRKLAGPTGAGTPYSESTGVPKIEDLFPQGDYTGYVPGTRKIRMPWQKPGEGFDDPSWLPGFKEEPKFPSSSIVPESIRNNENSQASQLVNQQLVTLQRWNSTSQELVNQMEAVSQSLQQAANQLDSISAAIFKVKTRGGSFVEDAMPGIRTSGGGNGAVMIR